MVPYSQFTQKVKNSDGTYSYIRHYFETTDRAVSIDEDIKDWFQDGTDLHTALTDICNSISANQTLADNAYKLAKGVSSSFVFATTVQLVNGASSNVGAMGSYALTGDTSKPGFKVGDNVYIVETGVPDFWISGISTSQSSSSTQATAANLKTATNGSSYWIKWGNWYVTITATEVKTNLGGYATEDFVKNGYVSKTASWNIKGDDVSGSGTYSNGLTLTLKNVGTAGTYSAVKTDEKGRVVSGGQMVVFATSRSDTALNSLAEGGIAIITEA